MQNSNLYSTVRENFKRVKEFGWYLPHYHSTFYYPPIIEDHVSSSDNGSSTPGTLDYRQAAVIFLLSLYKGKLHVLMTKRSTAVRTHKGEDCLPGGVQEPGETSPIDTAMREAQEETGLDPKFVDVIAVAPPFAAGVTLLTTVSPVICLLNTDPESLTLTPDGKEVDCVYWMPIEVFLENTHAEVITGKWIRRMMGFHFDSPETGKHHFVWGLTAMISVSMSSIALNRAPAFPYMFNQNVCVANVTTERNSVIVHFHYIVLTTRHIEEWKGYVMSPECLKPTISIDKWTSCHKIVSKL